MCFTRTGLRRLPRRCRSRSASPSYWRRLRSSLMSDQQLPAHTALGVGMLMMILRRETRATNVRDFFTASRAPIDAGHRRHRTGVPDYVELTSLMLGQEVSVLVESHPVSSSVPGTAGRASRRSLPSVLPMRHRASQQRPWVAAFGNAVSFERRPYPQNVFSTQNPTSPPRIGVWHRMGIQRPRPCTAAADLGPGHPRSGRNPSAGRQSAQGIGGAHDPFSPDLGTKRRLSA